MTKPTGPWLDFASVERPARPNTALACSAEICLKAESSRPLMEFPAPAQRVADALRTLEPSAEFMTLPNGDIRARYVAVTALMRFKDDVDVLIRPAGEARSVVAVYSRSRVGYSDLGTNAKRVDKLEERLRAALGA